MPDFEGIDRIAGMSRSQELWSSFLVYTSNLVSTDSSGSDACHTFSNPLTTHPPPLHSPSPFIPSHSPPNANYTKHRLILGTHTSRTSQDYLMIAEVTLPKAVPESTSSSAKEVGGNGSGDVLKDYSEERKGELLE